MNKHYEYTSTDLRINITKLPSKLQLTLFLAKEKIKGHEKLQQKFIICKKEHILRHNIMWFLEHLMWSTRQETIQKKNWQIEVCKLGKHYMNVY